MFKDIKYCAPFFLYSGGEGLAGRAGLTTAIYNSGSQMSGYFCKRAFSENSESSMFAHSIYFSYNYQL